MTGLESNGYYINNEIRVGFTYYNSNEYFDIKFENLSIYTQPQILRSYTDIQNTGFVNIQNVIKGMFDKNSNSNVFRITFTPQSGNAPEVITKTFIRGGERSVYSNRNAVSSYWLKPSLKYPVFKGMPITYDYINSDYTISTIPNADVPSELLDFRNIRGCNGAYVKFLNQLGGYSYWFFESVSITESNTNLGGFIRDNQVNDFGNEVNNVINAYSKFPKEYADMAKDLIVSPEIYIYQEGIFNRIRSSKNSIEKDSIKRAYGLKMKFEIDFRFNPSILW